MTAWPDAVLARCTPARLQLVGPDPGEAAEILPLPTERWHGPVAGEDVRILQSARSPVLDIGCGPGRHAAALTRAGHHVLGIDTSAAAVRSARRRGARAERVSVFGAVPSPGKWGTALLLDGNIGIGGDPARLLDRVRELLAAKGLALVEVDRPGVGSRPFQAQVHHAEGIGPHFPWARVGADSIADTAAGAGFRTVELWSAGMRWFAELEKRL
jgi:SAM-dependent methyltransferase